MNPEAMDYLNKAARAIKATKTLFDNELYEDACSKAYYVMFYAAQALLKNEGINVTKHSAVVAKLGECFAKPGRIDPKYHRSLIEAKEKREVADYWVSSTIDQETAEDRIKEAKEFLKEVKRLLKVTESRKREPPLSNPSIAKY